MKNIIFLIGFTMIVFLQSCQDKNLTEVVEVPLPTADEKLSIGSPQEVTADEGSFQLQKLPYKYEALAPYIDPLTMETHYSKIYVAHLNALNRAVENTPLEELSIEELLTKIDLSDSKVRYNAGGYYNHNMFFDSMAPKTGGVPKDTLANTIKRDFGSFENFKKQFADEARTQFGSSWTWLVLDKSGKLVITSTQLQDNPLMKNALIKGKPILVIDLWEHAYFLSYQQKRKNYIEAFFNVVNWPKVQDRFENALVK
jgi:Fe-Mn family superoxide dismutase